MTAKKFYCLDWHHSLEKSLEVNFKKFQSLDLKEKFKTRKVDTKHLENNHFLVFPNGNIKFLYHAVIRLERKSTVLKCTIVKPVYNDIPFNNIPACNNDFQGPDRLLVKRNLQQICLNW